MGCAQTIMNGTIKSSHESEVEGTLTPRGVHDRLYKTNTRDHQVNS